MNNLLETGYCLLEVDDAILPAEIKLYPNPADDKLFFELKNNFNQNIDINIYNETSQLVFSVSSVTAPELYNGISVQHLPKGFYFLQLVENNSGNIYFSKFIIQR